jgi:integrase
MTKKLVKLHGNPRWRITHQEANNSVRKHFKHEKDADRYLTSLKKKRKTIIPALMALGELEQMQLIVALDEIKSLNTTLPHVLRHYKSSKTKLTTTNITLKNCVNELLTEKKLQNLRPRYIQEINSTLNSFILGRENKTLNQITKPEILDYINAHNWSDRRKVGVIGDLHMLWNWAIKNEYTNINLIQRIPKPKLDDPIPNPLNIPTTRALLSYLSLHPEALATISLCLFAGLRSSEAAQILPNHIDLVNNTITVTPATAKKRQLRQIDISPNLHKWLSLALHLNSPLPLSLNRLKHIQFYHIKPVLNIPRNSMRHAFISYHLALHQNLNLTALHAGNSPDIILKHYRKLVPKSDASAFWNITPCNLSLD